MEKDNNHNFEYFRRYHFGEMNEAEQHHFEKQMLEDPFLQAAYEGYEMMLKDGVDTAQRKFVLLAPTTSRPQIWRYAAAATVLIAVAFFYFQRQFIPSEKVGVAFKADSQATEVINEVSVLESVQHATEAAHPPVVSKKTAIAKQKKTKIKVVDEGNNPFPGVFVSQSGKGVGLTNSEGEIEIGDANGQIVELIAVGYLPRKVTAERSQTVTMQADSARLNEVIVVGYSTGKETTQHTVKNTRTGAFATPMASPARFPNPELLDLTLDPGSANKRRSDERLASNFVSGWGEVVIIKGTPKIAPKDSLPAHQKKIYLLDADRKNWEASIRRATRNSLILGEGIGFGILSIPDSVILDLTHDQMQELETILKKLSEEHKEKPPHQKQ